MRAGANMITHGIDLGQTNDYTAHAVIETLDGISYLRFITRMRDMRYDDMMKRSAQIIHSKFGNIWGDATGAASPAAFDILEHYIEGYPCVLTRVKITGGDAINVTDFSLNVPRGLLIDNVRIGIQNQTIKFPKTLTINDVDMAEVLYKEILNFQSELSTSGNVIYKTRQGKHDDMLFAVALAYYGSMQGLSVDTGYTYRHS